MTLKPNRVAVYLTAIAGLAAAIAVPVGNLNTHSTTAVVAGLGAIAAAVVKWLDGWQKHEARVSDADLDELPHVPTIDAPPVPDHDQAGSA